MNPTGKKFVSLFLILSLMMLSLNLSAKERRGAIIVITKKDGTQFQGELIAVKQNSLLILVPSGKDVSFGIEEIMAIRIVRRKFRPLRIGGLVSGAVIGSYIGISIIVKAGEEAVELGKVAVVWVGIILVPLFATIGAALGILPAVLTDIKAKFQIEGMTDSEIQETLDKLRKQARIRDYK